LDKKKSHKEKKNNKKFYGYTGPVKPESSWITKKGEPKSYAKTEIVEQAAYAKKKKALKWISKKKTGEN